MQVHKEPALLDRILNHLDAENHYYAINIDKKSKDRNKLDYIISKHRNVVLLTHLPISYGGFSFANCTVMQLKELQYCNPHMDFYHTISGQDYPCVSNWSFDKWFETNDKKSWIMIDSDEQVKEWRNTVYEARINYWHFNDVCKGRISDLFHLNGVARRIVKKIERPCPFFAEIRGGWNWWSLHSSAVKMMLDYYKSNPSFLKRFKYTVCADEFIFTTVLHKYRDVLLIEEYNSLRYVEWNPNREYNGLPLILKESEYEDIINSGALFCRKVSTKDSIKLLELLDQRIANMKNDIVLNQHPKHPFLI